MTTNPKAHTILCYGDSNTWGQKPDKSGRYPVDVRWTGRLQKQLGDDFYVIEEGLSSRTTDLEYSQKPGRNGKTYLIPCLVSHNPIELVVLMLGTNDLKIEFHRSPQDIAHAIKGLVANVTQFAHNKDRQPPKILLVSPILINDKAPTFDELYGGVYYDADSAAKSTQLANTLKAVADESDVRFLDASAVAAPGEDGIHFTEDAHGTLANTIESLIHDIIQ